MKVRIIIRTGRNKSRPSRDLPSSTAAAIHRLRSADSGPLWPLPEREPPSADDDTILLAPDPPVVEELPVTPNGNLVEAVETPAPVPETEEPIQEQLELSEPPPADPVPAPEANDQTEVLPEPQPETAAEPAASLPEVKPAPVQQTLFPEPATPLLPDRDRAATLLALDEDLEVRAKKTRRLRLISGGVLAMILTLGSIGGYEWYRTRSVVSENLLQPRRITPEGGFATDPAIAPNGKFAVYASDRGGGNLAIWVQHLDSDEPSRLTGDTAHDSEPDVHPDGNRVVFRSERDGGGVYVASLLSSDPPKLLAKDGRRPRYSPDGKWIAYYDKNGATPGGNGARLFVMPADGGPARQVRSEFSIAQLPVWMPDSKRIIFDGTSQAGATDWWVTPLDDGPVAQTNILPAIQQAFWSIAGPDHFAGSRVFFSASAGDERHIWSIGLSPNNSRMEGEPVLITAGDKQYGEMRSGPDGVVAYGNERTTMDVWVAPLAGDEGRVMGDLRRISKDANYSHLPSVDAEGKHIIYLSNRSGVEDLWISDVDGESESAVTTDLRIAYRPVLSADGTRLIVSTVEGKKCSVVVADIARRQEEVALEGCAGIWDWSPDRKSVVFFDPDGVGSRAAHVMQIPSGRRSEILWHPKMGIYNVRFSPDGKWLVFTAGATIGTAKVYVAPFRESVIAPEQWILISDTDGSGPTWSPGGKLIYYRSRRDGFDCIWARALDWSKRPTGQPFAILHLHKPSRGLFQLPESSFVMAVTKDRIVLTMARHSGDIWLARLRQ